jgi:hypothetical protein
VVARDAGSAGWQPAGIWLALTNLQTLRSQGGVSMRRSSHRNDRSAQAVRKRRRWGGYLPRLETLEDRTLLSIQLSGIPDYQQEGPGPITGGSASVQHDEAAGAINAIAINTTVAYAATTNGGIWKTTNLNVLDGSSQGQVQWTPLTDQNASLSIDSIAFLPGDDRVVYAGTDGK